MDGHWLAKTGHRAFIVTIDKWLGIRRNGYQCIYECTQEEQKAFIESMQDKVITFDTATTNEQKKVLLEISKTIQRDYIFPSQFENKPFFNRDRIQSLLSRT